MCGLQKKIYSLRACYLIINFDLFVPGQKIDSSCANGQFRLHIPLLGGRKRGVFIGSLAPPWRADSKNVYMSIANIIASG